MMYKLLPIITGILAVIANCFGGVTNGPELTPRIKANIWKAVVKLESSCTNKILGGIQIQTGTGFIVSKDMIRGTNHSRVRFLITNKHMLGDWKIDSGVISNYYEQLNINYYTTNLTPSVFKIKDVVDSSFFVPHPNPTVDIVIIALLNKLMPPDYTASFDVGYLLPFTDSGLNSIGLGDQVFALGYPRGITSLNNNYPIAKAGYIASLPREEFRIMLQGTTELKGRVYLVDGLLVPGNSGGPVLTPSEVKFRINPDSKNLEHITKSTDNLIIGIMSMSLSDTGLSIVYSSDYITELIESFDNRIGSIEANILHFR